MKHHRLTISSTSAGAVTDQHTRPLSGCVAGFYLEIGTLANTTDITITDDETGAAILTITNAAASGWYPVRIGSVDAAGAAQLFAAGGTAVPACIPIDGTMKIAVAQPGNSKLGAITVYVED